MKTISLKYSKKILYFFFLTTLSLLILECCFRFQLIDFYNTELKGLNTKEQLNSTNNILVFGDSFTAHPDSYLSFLRIKFPNYNFVNSSIPGTGILQHELIFKKRILQFKPKVIIYQFYIGNDFLDIEHPVNFKETLFFKNIYWKLSKHALILQYINSKLAFLNSNNQPIEKLHKPLFSVDQYNNRVKSNYRLNANTLNNSILLSDNNSKNIYKIWKDKIISINTLTNDSVPVYLLLIPHNSQINSSYFNQNLLLGAKLEKSIMKTNFPLIKTIKTDFKNWKIISPLADFQNLESSDSLYYQNDPHLTLWGHKKLSEIVAKELQLNE